MGESARTRVWILPVGGGEPAPLTDEKTEISAFEWSPDGAAIACLAVDRVSDQREKEEKAGRDAKVVDQDLRPRRLWIVDVASGVAEKLAALGDLSAWDFAWSPDGSALVATATELNRTDDAYLMKRIYVLPRSGERHEIVPMIGKIAEIAWSWDGKTIAWIGGVDASDPWTGSLFVVPAGGGTIRNLTGAREESATSISWRRDGRLNVINVQGTRSTLWLVDPGAGTWEIVVPPGLAAFTSSTWSEDGSRFAFAGSTAAAPTDVWSGSIVASGPAPSKPRKGRTPPTSPAPPVRIVNSNPQLEALPRGGQETVRFRAKDGLEIEGVVLRPAGFAEGTRYPLIVIAHGGPESYYLDGWQNAWSHPGHALAERGFLVFFPNYRGSTGRGVAFAKADHKDLGGKELTDILDGIDTLASKGWIDPKRVGIMGGSYGGYLTALGVTRHSDRFAAGVDMFGITNWESFLGESDIPVENASVHWDLWCYEHAGLCRERSAIGNIDHAATPTLILQGQDDERVPKPQSDELYAALKWRKVPVEYVTYPREKHGFSERAHRLDALTRTLDWMERYLQR
jgi:dipeptidyl aminopeptidase/acylaminoacyl peptidase